MSQFLDELLPAIRSILASSDPENITAKRVRKTLIAQGVDEAGIKAHKEELDERIQRIYLELLPAQADAPAPVAETDVKPARRPTPPPASSPARAAPTSPYHPLARAPKPRAPAPAESDEAMARRLQAEFDAGGLGRASRAGKAQARSKAKAARAGGAGKRKSRDEVVSSGDEEDDGEDGAVKPKKRRKAVNADGEKRTGGGGGLQAPMVLSAPLAALIHQTHLSRPQTVKALWAHIRAHDLQDPADKRVIRCDEGMRSVFGCERMSMFQMNKLLSPHLAKPEEIQQ